jgi:hypothetical protein
MIIDDSSNSKPERRLMMKIDELDKIMRIILFSGRGRPLNCVFWAIG